MALGKRSLRTGIFFADDIVSVPNIKQAAKRRAVDAGKDLVRGVLTTSSVRLQTRQVGAAKRRRKGHMMCSTMAFVHMQSCEGAKSEWDLFGVPPTQTSIDAGQWVENQSMDSLNTGGPIRIFAIRIGNRSPASSQCLPVRASEGDQWKWDGHRCEQCDGSL